MNYRTFVSVGNALQPFTRLLTMLESVADVLPEPVLVQAGHTPWSSARFHVVDFLPMDEFLQRLADADVVVLHGGATSLQALAAGKTPIVVARQRRHGEHVDDHQMSYARRLAEIGRIRVADDADELRRAIGSVSRGGAAAAAGETRAVAAVRRELAALAGGRRR